MGFEEDPKSVLEMAEGDLRDMGSIIYYKKNQHIDTLHEHILLGAPKILEEEAVQRIFDSKLKALEVIMQQEDPDNFPLDGRGKNDWISFTVIKDWPEGMPWENNVTGNNMQMQDANQMAEYVSNSL